MSKKKIITIKSKAKNQLLHKGSIVMVGEGTGRMEKRMKRLGDSNPIMPIKTVGDYQKALIRIDELVEAGVEEGSVLDNELGIWITLAHGYEKNNIKLDKPDPIEAIKFRMEQIGMKESELGKILGYRSRKADILSRRRKLNLAQIRKIHEALKIPALRNIRKLLTSNATNTNDKKTRSEAPKNFHGLKK